MKLLIVDDNPKMRKMLKDILANNFDEIIEHNDGLGADKIYSKVQPDWVLMDIKMKNVDGISATKNILGEYPRAKVIVVSHYNDPDIKKDAILAGAIKFISKNNLFELLDVLK